MSQTPPNTPTPPDDLPPISEADAEQFVAEAAAEAAAAEGNLTAEGLENLRTPEAPSRKELPPTPLEEALGETPPTVKKRLMDAAWLNSFPEINVRASMPSDEDKERYAVTLITGEPFLDKQAMLGGKVIVIVETVTGDVLDIQYNYIKSLGLEKEPDRYFSELQFAGAAIQVREIGNEKLAPVTTTDQLRERVAYFRKMQNHRWALVLLAVRQAMLKNRALAEMIVNYDAVFTTPGASA